MDWYRVSDIHQTLQSQTSRPLSPGQVVIPRDVTSWEFAEWLTLQYRSAMIRGFRFADAQHRESTTHKDTAGSNATADEV